MGAPALQSPCAHCREDRSCSHTVRQHPGSASRRPASIGRSVRRRTQPAAKRATQHATKHVTQLVTQHATQHATNQQFSTMSLRASFARSKPKLDNQICNVGFPWFTVNCGKMLVFLARPRLARARQKPPGAVRPGYMYFFSVASDGAFVTTEHSAIPSPMESHLCAPSCPLPCSC